MHERVEQYEAGLPVGVHSETGELVAFEAVRRDPESVIATESRLSRAAKFLACGPDRVSWQPYPS